MKFILEKIIFRIFKRIQNVILILKFSYFLAFSLTAVGSSHPPLCLLTTTISTKPDLLQAVFELLFLIQGISTFILPTLYDKISVLIHCTSFQNPFVWWKYLNYGTFLIFDDNPPRIYSPFWSICKMLILLQT